jgi:subtilisin family serine protease
MSKLYYAKVLGDNGSGSFVSVAKGIDWCVEQGAHIINMSLGGRTPSAAMKTAIDNALKTSIVVAAVGNDGTGDVDNIGYPAKLDNVLAVGSIDQTFKVSYFSSSGTEGDIVAPGSSILSTWTDQSYRVLSGTSMATPYVSGLIALYLEAYPEHNTELTIEEVLESHAIDIEPQGFDRYTFEGIVSNEIFKRSIDTIHQEPVVDPVTPPSVVRDWRVWVLLILVASGLIVNYIKNRQ